MLDFKIGDDYMKNREGFTFIELVTATFIAVLVLGALLSVINYSFGLQETNSNIAIAYNAAREKIEQIRNTSFGSIVGTYNPQVFNPSGFTVGAARGRITASYVTGSNSNLIDIRVVICWRQRNGRIIGEDNGRGGGTALDGILNGTEDINPSNGLIDSPCVLSASISKKS